MKTLFRAVTLASLAWAGAAAAQTGHSVWQGVYTDAQAARGKTQYDAQCAMCHGPALEGNAAVPPLKGRKFLFNWDGQPASDLVQRIQTTMPMTKPGSLDRKTVADITAYIFKSNGFPAGATELPDAAEPLASVAIAHAAK